MLYRFGKSITDKYLFPYNQKVWDYPPEKMDLFWVEGRVPQPPLKDVLSSAMGLNSEGYTHQSNFFYPRVGGMQSIVDSISKKVPQITCNFDVKSVKKEDGLWFVSDSKKEYSFKKLVSTIHLGDLISCIKDAPKEVRSAAAGLKWNSMYLVFIGLKKPKVNDLHWTYIPDSDVLPNRLSFPSNLSPNSAPKGHSSVLAEITFDPNGPKSKLSLDEVVSKTIEDLHRINVFDKSDVVYSKAIKIKYAYVVYDLDYQKNISVLENYSKEQGITLLGRFSEFKYYNSDKCVESAMEKAKLFV